MQQDCVIVFLHAGDYYYYSFFFSGFVSLSKFYFVFIKFKYYEVEKIRFELDH